MGKPGRVVIFSAKGVVPIPLRNVIDARAPVVIVHSMEHWRAQVDYYCTTTALSSSVERAAAAVSAIPVVLPEGGEWLAHQLWRRVTAQLDSYVFCATRVGEPAFIPYQMSRRS